MNKTKETRIKRVYQGQRSEDQIPELIIDGILHTITEGKYDYITTGGMKLGFPGDSGWFTTVYFEPSASVQCA
jgi:hypothetical protein